MNETNDSLTGELKGPAPHDPMEAALAGEEESPESQITRALLKELVRLRKGKKIAQEPVAKAIGITQGRLSQIEHSKGGSMSLEAFIRYAQTIGAVVVLQPSDEENL